MTTQQTNSSTITPVSGTASTANASSQANTPSRTYMNSIIDVTEKTNLFRGNLTIIAKLTQQSKDDTAKSTHAITQSTNQSTSHSKPKEIVGADVNAIRPAVCQNGQYGQWTDEQITAAIKAADAKFANEKSTLDPSEIGRFQISPNFTFSVMFPAQGKTRLIDWLREGSKDGPKVAKTIKNAIYLFNYVIEPLILCNVLPDGLQGFNNRKWWFSSGVRTIAVNRSCQGANNSQHLIGQAVDIHTNSSSSTIETHAKIVNKIRERSINVDQLILGKLTNYWIHVSYDYQRQRNYSFAEGLVSIVQYDNYVKALSTSQQSYNKFPQKESLVGGD